MHVTILDMRDNICHQRSDSVTHYGRSSKKASYASTITPSPARLWRGRNHVIGTSGRYALAAHGIIFLAQPAHALARIRACSVELGGAFTWRWSTFVGNHATAIVVCPSESKQLTDE